MSNLNLKHLSKSKFRFQAGLVGVDTYTCSTLFLFNLTLSQCHGDPLQENIKLITRRRLLLKYYGSDYTSLLNICILAMYVECVFTCNTSRWGVIDLFGFDLPIQMNCKRDF